MKGPPLAYNKDMQEDKEAIFDAVDTLELCLRTITPMLDTMKALPEMRRAAAKGFINATDCADYLTKRACLPGCPTSLPAAWWPTASPRTRPWREADPGAVPAVQPLFALDIYEAIDLVHCCEDRQSYGGPAPPVSSSRSSRHWSSWPTGRRPTHSVPGIHRRFLRHHRPAHRRPAGRPGRDPAAYPAGKPAQGADRPGRRHQQRATWRSSRLPDAASRGDPVSLLRPDVKVLDTSTAFRTAPG